MPWSNRRRSTSTRSPSGPPRRAEAAGRTNAGREARLRARTARAFRQGAGRGYSGVTGLNALLAVLSTPGTAPVIAAARLRRGVSASVRRAGKLVADALATARRAGITGQLVVRGDSAFYAHDIVAACQRAGAHYSLTVREFPSVVTAISLIRRAGLDPDPLPQRHLRRRRRALGL